MKSIFPVVRSVVSHGERSFLGWAFRSCIMEFFRGCWAIPKKFRLVLFSCARACAECKMLHLIVDQSPPAITGMHVSVNSSSSIIHSERELKKLNKNRAPKRM